MKQITQHIGCTRRYAWLLTCFLTLLACTGPALGQHLWQQPKDPVPREVLEQIIGPVDTEQPSKPLHIVWVWGYDKSHKPGTHDYLRVRDAMSNLLEQVPEVTVEPAYEFPSREQFDKADLVVMYLHLPQLSDDQYAMFKAYIEGGGGVVALHEAAIMRPASEGRKLCGCIGMAWDQGRSQWGAVFDDISIRNDHEIFSGFAPTLSIVDEFYWHLQRMDEIDVLGEVRTGPPGRSERRVPASMLSEDKSPVFWTYEPGQGRVFGTTLGHNTFTYFDPEFRIVIFRAMAWAVREKPDPFMPLVFEGITREDGTVGTTDDMRDWEGKLRGPEEANQSGRAAPRNPNPSIPPNVILILTDDQGYGDLSCHGNPHLRTPALDQLHAQSVRLTDFHVESSCAPTRATLMTGRFDTRAGVLDTVRGRSLLRRGQLTWPSLFRQAGYKTAIFGKWHLGDNYPFRPQDHGFDEVLIHGGGGAGNTSDYWANDYFDDTYFHNGDPKKFEGFCTNIWFAEATRFIEAQRGEQPFVCYISTNAPHLPFVARQQDLARYADQADEGVRGFYAMISNIDDNIAKLRRRLSELGIADNTILIFMTDNGSAKGSRLYNAGMRGAKGSPYEGGHRVPCFIHWPAGGMDQGRDIDALTAGIDLLPTLAEFAGLEIPTDATIDGTSLAGLIRRGEALAPRVLVTDYQNYLTRPEKWRRTVVMKDKWRLIDRQELYNIEQDPGQQRNLIQDYPDLVAELERAYNKIWADMEPGFDDPVDIVIGSDQQNPTTITAHDIVGDCVWNHDQVLAGAKATGHWEVEVAQAGRYAFTLRRYPEEAQLPILGTIDVPQDLRTFRYFQKRYEFAVNNEQSRSLPITAAAIQIGSYQAQKAIPTDPVQPNADYETDAEGLVTGVLFEADLEPGRTKLKAWFIDADGKDLTSAYYVAVQRLR
ncbi:MAG: sulfatase-like hydrolase/transferase [Planctomycetota bacterium]